MKTAWGWSAKLTRLIVLKDGTRLVTLGDVRAFILKQPEHIQERVLCAEPDNLLIVFNTSPAANTAPSTNPNNRPTRFSSVGPPHR
jgi:hypothetical protein